MSDWYVYKWNISCYGFSQRIQAGLALHYLYQNANTIEISLLHFWGGKSN